ncbi:hypothetical protein KPH14_005795 [Odynerus spinipes]|uniref:Uncharacterized protein n=1 Tax=Odynerus spinipes TaxID=1348599 RepID=A0AAD9RB23_9HYME|nr:hypothetical protein KPH14_005795 [Odynerus spinipes]
MSEEQLSDYSWQMNLTVNSLEKGDFGGYVCTTVNALGKAEGVVRLQELQLFAKTTPSVLTKNTETRLRKKPSTKERKKMNGGSNSNRRRVHVMGGYDDSDSIGNEDDLGTTQIMAGSTSQEGGKTERPLALPSLSPPWIDVNAASSRHRPIARDTILLLVILARVTILF